MIKYHLVFKYYFYEDQSQTILCYGGYEGKLAIMFDDLKDVLMKDFSKYILKKEYDNIVLEFMDKHAKFDIRIDRLKTIQYFCERLNSLTYKYVDRMVYRNEEPKKVFLESFSWNFKECLKHLGFIESRFYKLASWFYRLKE